MQETGRIFQQVSRFAFSLLLAALRRLAPQVVEEVLNKDNVFNADWFPGLRNDVTSVQMRPARISPLHPKARPLSL
jgi:hypothetical protein